MDKSLDELAAEGNKGKRRREDDGRRQGRRGGGGWQGQGGGGGGWQGQGGGGGGWQGGQGGDRRDGVRVRRGAEGLHRPVGAAYCFFGDSFVRLFGLVRHPEVSVQAFKGATCRGLGKEGNENRVDITRRLAAKPETKVAVTHPSP